MEGIEEHRGVVSGSLLRCVMVIWVLTVLFSLRWSTVKIFRNSYKKTDLSLSWKIHLHILDSGQRSPLCPLCPLSCEMRYV